MCIQDCRSFLWGGTGNPSHDPAGTCFCVCDDDGWSDVNILGRASCVPVKAHLIFGWVGFAVSVVALFHVVYHLVRQMKFHAQQSIPVISPVERCRRDMHTTAVIANILGISYFAMVIGNKFRSSAIVMAVSISPSYICSAVFAGRMWIYTNDPRLMKESPKVVAISAWLERPQGQHVTYIVVSIAPGAAMILAAVNKMEAAIKVLSVGSALLVAVTGRTFWICGISLMQAIDESLRKKQGLTEKTDETQGARRYARKGVGASEADPILLSAQKRVKHMMIFTAYMCTSAIALCVFCIFSKYATMAPLLLISVPSLLTSLVWNSANIQLHSGRTKLRDTGGSRLLSSVGCFPKVVRSKYLVVQVVPVSDSASAS